MVLARIDGAPSGTRGLSLFIVPKHLVGPDGSLEQRNGVFCRGVEKKMGFHGSPTCTFPSAKIRSAGASSLAAKAQA
jgi:acyl-CoA dehydrogenase